VNTVMNLRVLAPQSWLVSYRMLLLLFLYIIIILSEEHTIRYYVKYVRYMTSKFRTITMFVIANL
jgi:hypothetical protein